MMIRVLLQVFRLMLLHVQKKYVVGSSDITYKAELHEIYVEKL